MSMQFESFGHFNVQNWCLDTGKERPCLRDVGIAEFHFRGINTNVIGVLEFELSIFLNENFIFYNSFFFYG